MPASSGHPRRSSFLGSSVRALALAWAVVSALAAIFGWVWLRERYSRGGPIPVSQASMLLNPARRHMHPPRETLESFGLQAGETLLELGPGPGYFTIEARRIAGEGGRVVCIDVQPGMLALLRQRLVDAGVSGGVVLLAGDAAHLPLAPSSVDRAFLSTVLGEIPDRPAAVAELRRVVRLGGAVAVLETLTDPDYQLEASVRDLFAAYGFVLEAIERRRLGYTVRFVAPGG